MTTFLCLVVVLLFCAMTQAKLDQSLMTDELRQLMEATRSICVQQTGVDEEHIKKLNEEGEFEDDDKFKCYTKCVMQQIAMMSEDGAISFGQIQFAAILPPPLKDTIQGMVDNCAHFTDEDLCERSFNAMKCAQEHDPEHFFLM